MVEFSVLRGISGCLWYNFIKAGCMLISVFTLLKLPHISSYADENTTLRIVLNSV